MKSVYDITERVKGTHGTVEKEGLLESDQLKKSNIPLKEIQRIISELEKQMKEAAKALEFEKAAAIRDQIYEMRALFAEESNLPPWKKARLLAGED